MYSHDTTGAFTDLNTRYNFYDLTVHNWNWIDSDFMWSAVNVFDRSTGFGCLDVEPGTGVAVVSACAPPPLPQVAVEESRQPRAPSLKSTVSIVRGVLFLPPSLSPPSSLLSTDGRKVLDLKPGPNDVSRLGPGVYFVREAQAQAQAVRKVVIAR
jgi:hypothetical protein